MEKGTVAINKRILAYIFLTLPFYSSAFFSQIKIVDVFFDVYKVLSAVIITVTIFSVKRVLSLPAVICVVINLYLVAVSFACGSDLKRAVTTTLPIIAMVLIYELGISDIKNFIKSQYIIFSCFIYINLILEIKYPTGLYIAPITHYWQNWFLGFYNNHSIYFIPAICIGLFYMRFFHERLSVYLLFFSIAVSAIIVRSGGVLMALIIMFVYWLLFRKSSYLYYYLIWGIHVVFFVLIIMVQNERLVSFFITVSNNLFNKGRSFYSRYILWKKAVLLIKEKPLFGHGLESQMMRLKEYTWGLHAHNMTLEILHQGGVIYLLLFVTIVIICGVKLSAIQDKYVRNVLSLSFLGWVTVTLVEPFITALLMPLFILTYNCNDLVDALNGKE